MIRGWIGYDIDIMLFHKSAVTSHGQQRDGLLFHTMN